MLLLSPETIRENFGSRQSQGVVFDNPVLWKGMNGKQTGLSQKCPSDPDIN